MPIADTGRHQNYENGSRTGYGPWNAFMVNERTCGPRIVDLGDVQKNGLLGTCNLHTCIYTME